MNNIINPLANGTVLVGTGNNYRIERPLGQGSFGITYLASVLSSDDKSITIYVAIKEFFMKDYDGREGSTVTSGKKDGETSRYRRKFRSEAKNLAKLSHENIIKVIDSFDQNGTSYYVMEYVDGGSLDDYIIEKGRLDEQDMLKKSIQIINALSYMHGKGMLHLDLKPGNVMLRKDGSLLLIDFGLAKQYDESGNPSSLAVGGGTPGYAPIEQQDYHGNGFPVTMDIYALGATMYKMITGKRAPTASNVLANGLPQDEMVRNGVSQATIKVIVKAMQPKVANRYQTVDKIRADINQILKSIKGHKTKRDDNNGQLTDNPKKHNKGDGFLTATTTFVIVGVIAILTFIIFSMPIPDENNKNIFNKVAELVLEHLDIDSRDDYHQIPLGEWYGSLIDGKMDGYGLLYYKDNDKDGRDVYIGEMNNGERMDDDAYLYYYNGDYYEGSFENDHFKKGTIHYNTLDSMYYEGTFVNDKPYNGVLYYKNGNIYSQIVKGIEK